MIRFTAHCAEDHDRVDFTDPGVFEAHMTETHGKRKPMAGTGEGGAPGWSGGRIQGPYKWTAPKVPADHEEALARIIAANPDDVVDVDIPGAVPDGLWRFDKDTDVPAHVLPRSVRPILEGAMDRGEPWLVQVNGPQVRLEVMRPSPTGEPGTTTAARVRVRDGKVYRVETVNPARVNAPTGWWADKITRARELFPAPGEAVMPAEPRSTHEQGRPVTAGYELGVVTVAGHTLPAVRTRTGQLKYQTWCSGMWLDADPITRATFRARS